jgi:hypothetical protein
LSGKGYKVVATGQEKDQQLIKQAGSSIIDLSMKTELKELIALTSRYRLFVGVDTGPFHIAAALGIPMVHISTSKFTLPLRWGPWQNRHVLVRKRSSCDLFCLPASCRETICADEIKPDEVMAAVETLENGGGNLTQEEAFFDWCRKSFSVIITFKRQNHQRAQKIYKALHHAGFYALMVDTDKKHDYQKLFKQHNTNILHAVDGSFKLRFQALISGRSLITPVLYVKDQPKLDNFDEFFNYYCQSFEQSKL